MVIRILLGKDSWFQLEVMQFPLTAENWLRKSKMKLEIPARTRSQYATQAIDALFYRPIFQISHFVSRSNIPDHGARRILKALEKTLIIRELRPGKGRRAGILVFPELIKITEAKR